VAVRPGLPMMSPMTMQRSSPLRSAMARDGPHRA
jgi:hypothetical protein